MFLARVIGTVVATQKHPSLEGIKLLILQPVNEFNRPNDEPVVAVDGTQMAGPGETVYCIGSREGALVLEDWFNPADVGILGIIDEIYVVTDGEGRVTHHGGSFTDDYADGKGGPG